MLEQRIVPASFNWSAGLGLSTFLDNEALTVAFADDTHTRVEFTLSEAVGDVWTGVDDPAIGLSGNGQRTLTVDTSALAGSLVQVGELNSNGLQLTIQGAGLDQPFPFALGAVLGGERGAVHFTGEAARFLGRLDLSVGHFGHYSFAETAPGVQRIDFDVPVVVEGGVAIRSAGDLRFDHPFTLVSVLDADELSVVAEQITVNADVRTVDPDGPGGRSVTASIQMLAARDILLNATLSTGDVESDTPDPTFSVIASGEIRLRSGHSYSAPDEAGSIIGTDNGRLVTGSVVHTAGGMAYSGGITVESLIGQTQLAAVDAMTTGDATTVAVNNQHAETTSGNIRLIARDGISSDQNGGQLSLRTGLAMASTGAGIDNAGYGQLYINDAYTFQDNLFGGDIFITSSAPLRLKEIVTGADVSNTVQIDTTSPLLVVELIPYFSADHVGLAGDQISFLASAGGAIEFLGPSSGLAFNIGDGNLQLVAGELRSRWWIGDVPGAVPDTIAGSGTVTIRSASGDGVSLGDLDNDDALLMPTDDLVLTRDFMAAFREGFAELIIGAGDQEQWITIASGIEVHDNLKLTAQGIRQQQAGRVKGSRSVVVDAATGSIGAESNEVAIEAADAVLLRTAASGRLGDIWAYIGTSNDLLATGLELGNQGSTPFPQVRVETGPDLQHVTLQSGAIFAGGTTELDDHLNLIAEQLKVDGLLSAPSMNLLGADGIQGGTLRTTSGDLRLHSVNKAIGGLNGSPVVVDVAGELLVRTEAPGGADGDVFIRSAGSILLGGMSTGPDPDVVEITSTGGSVTLGGEVIVNDDVQITSAGTVNLSVPEVETGSLKINSQTGVTGSGTIKSTNTAGIVLIAVNGGVGANGVPVNVLVQNGGKLITTSSGNQFVATTGVVAVDTLGAGTGQINIAGGTFQLTSSNGVANASTLAILTGGTLDIQGFDEVVSALSIDGGKIISTTGSILSTSGVVLVTTGEASGIGGNQNVEKSGEGGFIFHGDNPTTGQISVSAGTLILSNGANLPNSTIAVGENGTVTSTADVPHISVGTVAVATFGLVTAGNSPGIFGMRHLQAQPGGRMLIEIMGPDPGTGHDQIIVTESANITGMDLLLQMPSYNPAADAEFTIIDNRSSQPVIGSFAGVPEGSILTVAGVDFQLSYVGGDGNDVVLSRQFAAGPTDILLDNNTIRENQSNAELIGDFSTVGDAANVSHTYELVSGEGADDNALFSIVNGQRLVANDTFDFESQNTFSIRVRSAGSNGLSLEKVFTIHVTDVTELSGIDVQLGQNQRSYVRYLDAVFDRPEELADLLNSNRLQLSRYDLNGGSGATIPLPAYTISGNTIRFDFGVQGLGGNRNSNAGDGYYQLVFDEDGDGQFTAGSPAKSFHRLLGDVNGDGSVDAADKSQVLLANRTSNPESDANGDGIVNLTDVSLVSRAFGRKLNDDLFTDD